VSARTSWRARSTAARDSAGTLQRFGYGHRLPPANTSDPGRAGSARLSASSGARETILSDNDSKFCSRAVDAWAHVERVQLRFVRPGKPIENAYVESFNGRCRDECLDEHLFVTIDEARVERKVARRLQHSTSLQRPRQTDPRGVCAATWGKQHRRRKVCALIRGLDFGTQVTLTRAFIPAGHREPLQRTGNGRAETRGECGVEAQQSTLLRGWLQQLYASPCKGSGIPYSL
jgi:hypothetical protein